MSDQDLLNSYITTIKSLAKLFGRGCEFVIHSAENLEKAVIAIENGQVSGRDIGAPITNIALEYIQNKTYLQNNEPYFSTAQNGNNLRSITTPIMNQGRLIGLLCVNINLDMKLADLFPILTMTQLQAPTQNEYFGRTVEDMMQQMLYQVEANIIQDYTIPNQSKNKHIIYSLDEKGFFKLRNSVEILAEHLAISTHTIYAMLRKKED